MDVCLRRNQYGVVCIHENQYGGLFLKRKNAVVAFVKEN
jgi:hypothetical protein